MHTAEYVPCKYEKQSQILVIQFNTPIYIGLAAYLIGIEVDYRGEIAGIPPGPTKVRCLLLYWTGDHPAQCEIGKFLGSGGVHACRQDQLKGKYLYMQLQYIATCVFV